MAEFSGKKLLSMAFFFLNWTIKLNGFDVSILDSY